MCCTCAKSPAFGFFMACAGLDLLLMSMRDEQQLNYDVYGGDEHDGVYVDKAGSVD